MQKIAKGKNFYSYVIVQTNKERFFQGRDCVFDILISLTHCQKTLNICQVNTQKTNVFCTKA